MNSRPHRRRRVSRVLVLSCALALAMSTGCGGAQGDGVATLEDGDPSIERIEAPDAQTELPPHILVCGLHKNLELPLDLADDYLSDSGLSLYDFAHDERQLATWMTQYPGGRAYGFRHPPDDKSPGAAIGRSLSEPCFGNGTRAADVIRQVIVVRAGGADAREALHNLLREGRSVHFVIDRNGRVHEPLDPVHAAIAPTEHANVAIYVALVAPRRTGEWLPTITARGAASGIAGTTRSMAAGAPSTARLAIGAPDDVFAERRACTVAGTSVESETYTAVQTQALMGLLWALADEYPRIKLEAPIAQDGSMLRGPLDDSLYHVGVMTDYQSRAETVEPACLDLMTVLTGE